MPTLNEFRPAGNADVPRGAWSAKVAQPPSRSRVTFVVPNPVIPVEQPTSPVATQPESQLADRGSDLMTSMSAVCAPTDENTKEVRARLSAEVTPDSKLPRDGQRVPAVFRPADNLTAIGSHPVAGDHRQSGDLMDGLLTLPAVPKEMSSPSVPPSSTPVIADRQAEELAKSLGLAGPAPRRAAASQTKSPARPDEANHSGDLLAGLSTLGSSKKATPTPPMDSPTSVGEPSEGLARSSGPALPAQRDKTVLLIRPFTSTDASNSGDDLLGRLSALPSESPKMQRTAPRVPAAKPRPDELVAAAPVASPTAPPRQPRFAATSRELPDYFRSSDAGGDDLLEKLVAAHSEFHEPQLDVSPSANVPLADTTVSQDIAGSAALPPAADTQTAPPAKNKWLAMLPSFRQNRGDQNQPQDASTDSIQRQPAADTNGALAKSEPAETGTTSADDHAPAPARGLVSHWYGLHFSPPSTDMTRQDTSVSRTDNAAGALPAVAAADSTLPAAKSTVTPAPAVANRIAATGPTAEMPAQIELPHAAASEPLATNDAHAIAAAPTQHQPEVAAPPQAHIAESLAAVPPRPAELPANAAIAAQPVAQTATPPGATPNPAPGQVVVVVVGSPQGPSGPTAPPATFPQPFAVAPQPARPLGIPEFPVVPDSTYLNESVLAASGYMPMRLAMQPVPPTGDDSITNDATLPTPPQNGQPAAAAGSTATKPNGEADTIAGAEKLGDEPVNNELQFLRRETVLLKPGDWQVDIGLIYSYQQNDVPLALLDGGGDISSVVEAQVRQRELYIPFAVRYGWTKRTQLFVNVPVGWANTELDFIGSDETENDGGVGDITFGFTHLLRSNECRDIVFTFATTAPTGDSPFGPAATALPTAALGDGFWSFFGELLCIQTYDPVVVFTSIGTQQSIEREFFGDRVLPGGEYFWTFGTGFAVNPRVTLSTRFIAEYISDTTINGDRVPGTAQEPMSIRLASTIAHPDYFVEPFVQFGTNDDAIDTLFGVIWTY